MPRLREVPRAEADAKVAQPLYAQLFGERDPVSEPGTATGRLVGSLTSCPAITSNTAAASAADRHIGPTESSVSASLNTPWRDTRPQVGFSPVSPLVADGNRIDPPFDVDDVVVGEAPHDVDDGVHLADVGQEFIAQPRTLAGTLH